jgi:ADP-heptose:LPS heptosyltransferase
MNAKQGLRTLILALVRVLGLPTTYRARSSKRDAASKPRILLIRPDHLGDLVLTTPILAALRKHIPDAHITMMIGPWSSEIVARHPALDQLITCPFPGFQRAPQKPLAPYMLLLQTAQQLRRTNYDLAINLRPDFWWGAALVYLAGIPRRAGYAIQPGEPFLTHALPFTQPEHATVSNLRLTSAGLQALAYPAPPEPYEPERYPLHFAPTENERAWVKERLEEASIPTELPVIALHPGTGAAVKLWRDEAWARCLNTLAQVAPTRARIVLTGSQQERPMLEEISHSMETPPLLLTAMTVGQLAAVLGRARLVLGVDSGPLHLAVAQGTSTLQLFGPTDERIFGPWGAPEKHSIIRATQKCPGCATLPCGRLDFTPEELSAHPCVRLIPEQRVEEAIAATLNQALLPHNK